MLRDYIESCRHSSKDSTYVAEKIVNAFEMELFKDCKTFCCITIDEKDPLLPGLKKKHKESFLRGTWSQISNLIEKYALVGYDFDVCIIDLNVALSECRIELDSL